MSKRMTKLVRQAKRCPYCFQKTELVSNEEIYGTVYGAGKAYLCRPCNAYVGTHADGRPFGSLANEELRLWRNVAHSYFDSMWQEKVARGKPRHWARMEAYRWLRKQMHKSPDITHIGMFTIEECQQVVALCRQKQPDLIPNPI